jgi:hypothetical protein
MMREPLTRPKLDALRFQADIAAIVRSQLPRTAQHLHIRVIADPMRIAARVIISDPTPRQGTASEWRADLGPLHVGEGLTAPAKLPDDVLALIAMQASFAAPGTNIDEVFATLNLPVRRIV